MTPEQEATVERLRAVDGAADRDAWNTERLCEVIRTRADGWREEVKLLLAETETSPGLKQSEHIFEPTKRMFEKYLGLNARPQDELITTGFPDLDQLTSIEEGSLAIVGAHSGHGKSSIAMQIAFHVGTKCGPSLFYTTEMPSEQLALRLACTLAKVDSKRVRRGLCEKPEYDRLADKMPLVQGSLAWITDESLDVLGIRAMSRREVRRIESETGKKVRLIVVDYLQRVRAGKAVAFSSNREQHVHAVAMEFKEMAKELKVCVLSPAQLNDESNKRKSGRPHADDIRESKGALNEADVVLLVHNPFYQDRVENDEADHTTPEACEFIVGKGRNDGTGTTLAWFTPLYSRFDPMSDADKFEQKAARKRAMDKEDADEIMKPRRGR